jgi:hypothetical protein
MREAIIHIGTTKTGSTSAQVVLRKHRDDLVKQGAHYMRSPGASAHILLSQEAIERTRSGRGLDAPPRTDHSLGAKLDAFRAEFVAEMQSLPAHVDRVIMSDERLSYIMRDAKRIAALKEFLQPHFTGFTVLVYLRDQSAYLASRYSSLLRLGMADEPEELQSRDAQDQYYDYDTMLSRWESVFGRDAIRPRIYESTPEKSFDTVADFLSVCRVALAGDESESFRRANTSISFAGQQVLERLSKIVSDRGQKLDGPNWRYLAGAVRRAHPGKGWLPTRAEAEAFVAPYLEGNERVRARYFPDRPRLFLNDYSRFPAFAMTMSDTELFQAACQAMLEAIPRGERAPRGGRRARAAEEEAEAARERPERRRRGRAVAD